MLFPFLSTLLILLGGASSLHVPHDDVHSVAIGLLADGTQETLITTSAACRVLRTRDGGLSWQTVHGDGLEMARADFVVFDPHPLSRKFFIGTNQGVWSYSPDMGLVQFASQGLPTGSGNFVTQLATSAGNSDGPLFLANKDGQVWAWNRSTSQWSLSLDSGFPEERGQVAVHPQFDSSGGVGPEQGVAAAFAGVLYLSADGGNTWSVHSQFSLPALLPTDPTITAIAFSQDYSSSGNLVLATARENLANFTLDEGTLWRSSDFGVSFSPVHSFSSSIRALVATPSGPSGDAWFLAGLLEHPNRRNLLQSSGVFRSLDGGASWDDYGSAQDFVAEEDASDTISLGREKIIGFAVSPDFQQSGRILFGRSEGLFSSADEGLHWHRRNFRPVSHLRGLDVHQDAQGDLWSFGASYGSGTIVQNLSASTVELLDAGPMNYQDELILSPQYEEDGMFVVGGARGLAFWFDPNKGMNNPHGTLGWEFPPHLGYVRFVAFSPHFDARGLLGTDQTFFLSSSTGRWSNVRSIDGGLTAEPLTKMVGGGPAPWLRNLSVARTYDASTSAGRTDVYGSAAVGLFRLEDDRWRMIHTLFGPRL